MLDDGPPHEARAAEDEHTHAGDRQLARCRETAR